MPKKAKAKTKAKLTLEEQYLEAWFEHGWGEDFRPQQQYVVDGKRFDFAWPTKMLLVEIDGAGFGHGSIDNIHKNCLKRANAMMFGWRILVFSTKCLGSKEKRKEAVHKTLFLLQDKVLEKDGRLFLVSKVTKESEDAI